MVGAGADRTEAPTSRSSSGAIQVELPRGQLRVTGCVDQATLRVVLEALLG